MKRLISFLLVFTVILSLCGCKKEEIITYDLTVFSPSFENVYKHYSPLQSEKEKYILSDAASYTEFITEESRPAIESLTICDDNISAETAQEITDICKEMNIPVFFMMNDISKDITESYDKAFCIIEESLGQHFDPELGRVFMECRAELEALYDGNK